MLTRDVETCSTAALLSSGAGGKFGDYRGDYLCLDCPNGACDFEIWVAQHGKIVKQAESSTHDATVSGCCQ